MVVQLLKNFLTLYRTGRFIIMFTKALYWFLPSARGIQSTSPFTIYLRYILILSLHLRLRLPSSLFSFGFRSKTLRASLLTTLCRHVVRSLVLSVHRCETPTFRRLIQWNARRHGSHIEVSLQTLRYC
jgi:hypothetical protein